MSSWFDDNKKSGNPEETSPAPNGEKKENDTVVPSQPPVHSWSTSDSVPPVRPVPPVQTPSWAAPASPDNSADAEDKAEAPAGGADSTDSTDSRGQNPAASASGSTTYHYGVNAQNPVPNSTNNYADQNPQDGQTGQNGQQGYGSMPGGYRSPASNGGSSGGGYQPYGWQRTPTPPPGQNRPPYNTQPGSPYSQQNPYQSPYQQPGQSGQQPGQPGRPGGKPPRKKAKASTVIVSLVGVAAAAAIITLSVLLGLALNGGVPTDTSSTAGGTQSTQSGGTVNNNAASLEIVEDTDTGALTTPSIVNTNLDSTVVITMYSKSSSGTFGTNTEQEAGAASGIVMTADGYIITNWHVVIDESTNQPYSRIDVKTYDGTAYENATVVGADSDTDLAVIKVSAANLKPATFGDSTALQLGDKVVAIGNAGGLAWTTTQGIVSGLARDVYDDTGYSIKCLQIDAAINPGNSGGPLLNDQGKVVGINSAKISEKGYEGLGFSIPISEAKSIVDDLIKYGYVKNRVALGVSGQNITQPGYQGFMIQEIGSDSALADTQAKVGDIITHIDGTRVQTNSELRSEMAKHKVGDQITLTLLRVDSRTGATTTLTVTCKLKEAQG